MNKLGIYYAFWTHNWDADFVPFVNKVKGLGFDVLEVNSGTATNMNNAERDRLKNAAKDAGIELTFCIGLTKDYDLASEDSSVRQKGVEFLKRQVEMMKYMEARDLGGIIYSCWPSPLLSGNMDEKKRATDRSIECMKEVMKSLEGTDIIFSMEVVNRFEQYIMNTCDEAVEYVERVDSPNCKILLDTFHMNIEEDSFYDAIVKAGDKLGHLHTGEANRRAPGRGRIPWDEIGKALKDINYQGSIVMEPFLMPGGEVGRDISVYRDMSVGVDLDEEARQACAFMKEKLA